MHTVNGYCELLVRTDLTEEQALYVSSIQQACHAINVIAGNVLGEWLVRSPFSYKLTSKIHAPDFSKVRFQRMPGEPWTLTLCVQLDRNNVELSARPVLMNVRKMLEDLAKITEARGIQPGSPKVDVIVWVAQDVPQSVYLDETYAFRVLMNVRALS